MNRAAFVFVAGGFALLSACSSSGPHAIAKNASQAAPPNPDLTPVAERFYQQVEGGHLRFAYAMLSPLARAKLDRETFDVRYTDLQDAQIDARQAGDRAVTAVITVPARGSRPARVLRERLTFIWSGDEWTIAALDRHDVTSR